MRIIGQGLRLRGYAGLALWGLLGAATFAGCGLLDLDSFRGITFDLPEKSYVIDTSDPKWNTPTEGTVPTVACGPGALTQTCCDVPGLDCSEHPLVCEAGACVYQFDYEVGSVIDLKKEVPQLNASTADALSNILLKNIKVTVNNGLNMALPPVDIFVAPNEAASASDPRARKLVQVPSKPAGHQGTETLPLSAEAQQAFSGFATDFGTPFKIFARTRVTVKGGQPAPSGRATARIGGQVEAQI